MAGSFPFRRLRAAVLFAFPLLAACGGASQPVQSTGPVKRPAVARATPPPMTPRAPVRRVPQAQVQMLPGLEGVIGATAIDLSRQFGTARLDVWEGDARKLQFSGNACVLDVFLYPPTKGREPEATYVDARRVDGEAVDRAACVAALKRRR